MGEFLRGLGIDAVLCVAGLVGSLISVGRQSATNLRGTVVSVAAGVGAANYVTPVIVEQIGTTNPRWQTGLAFILGTLGLKVMEVISTKVDAEVEKRLKLAKKDEER
jgi:hypothetical protein